jgi:hypothetical protein
MRSARSSLPCRSVPSRSEQRSTERSRHRRRAVPLGLAGKLLRAAKTGTAAGAGLTVGRAPGSGGFVRDASGRWFAGDPVQAMEDVDLTVLLPAHREYFDGALDGVRVFDTRGALSGKTVTRL